MGTLYRIKNYIRIKKWLTAIVSLKAVPWAVFPEENEGNLHRSIQKLNTRPRKCLGFASPASRFFFELRGLHFRVESAQDRKHSFFVKRLYVAIFTHFLHNIFNDFYRKIDTYGCDLRVSIYKIKPYECIS